MENRDFKNEKAAKYWLHYFRRDDIPALSEKELQEESDLIFESLMNGPTVRPEKVTRLWNPSMAASAAAIVIIGLAILFYFNRKAEVRQDHLVSNKTSNKNTEIVPGINTATLILADGSDVVLSNAANGKIAEQQGVNIFKTTDNTLVYQTKEYKGKQPEFNTVLTAKGQQYQVVLPDGTKVWLNAASSVKFPATFADLKNRIITLTGEAYFEVAKDKLHPFIVKTAQQEIKVLGTHFNVNSYADEKATKTTLLEGSVLIHGPKQDVVLKPGQQAEINASHQKVANADVNESVAWKNGDFIFNAEDFSSVLRQVSRWYNVEIVDEVGHDGLRLTGAIPRNNNLSAVLLSLETAGKVKFQLTGRKVVVVR
ncbi:FecR family protein [Pedobacter sp. PWIIR3]